MITTRGQTGATLFMSLIMLLVLTLFVVSAITTSTVNLRIVGNMQSQEEVEAAAQLAIEQFVSLRSNFDFTIAPTTLPTYDIDVNHDGTNDYSVAIVRQDCLATAPLDPSSYLIFPDQNTWWDITARVTDTGASEALTTLHQGVRVALPASAICFSLAAP